MIISTVLSENPIIKGNSVTLPIVRTGTLAKDNNGKIHKIIQSAIDSSAENESGIGNVLSRQAASGFRRCLIFVMWYYVIPKHYYITNVLSPENIYTLQCLSHFLDY